MSGFSIGKDNFYIYSYDSAVDYLRSIGISEEEFERLAGILNHFYYEWLQNEEEYVKKDEVDDWECIADGYVQSYNNLCEEIDAECEKFLSGRKITKQAFVTWLKFKLEDGLYEY
mgnify:CR=1 FL=1